MELMEIIKSSLSIFSAISFVFILTSYTIYKIKDRTRIKPYLRVNMQSADRGFIIEEIEVTEKMNPDEKDNKLQQSPAEKDSKSEQVEDIKMRQVHERFKIVNQKNTVEQEVPYEPEPEVKKSSKKIRLSKEKKNIYDFYSDTDEKMHKLKLAVL